jgi:hypothetical protein
MRRFGDHISDILADEEWKLYQSVMALASKRGLPFVIGGGLAFSAYSGRYRNTKDMDVMVTPDTRDAMIQTVSDCGFVDYHDELPYDRSWIYRGHRDGVIFDTIWCMPNHRAEVDPLWMERGWPITIRGMQLRLLAPEELLWGKLYVVQRDRCDWPDILNIVHGVGRKMDWQYLFDRIGEDLPVLSGVMGVFRWMCPAAAQSLPDWIWPKLALAPPDPESGPSDCGRSQVLDGRNWFGPSSIKAK